MDLDLVGAVCALFSSSANFSAHTWKLSCSFTVVPSFITVASVFEVASLLSAAEESAADVAGLKLRVMENDVYTATFKALGVNAVPMAWSDALTALQQGTIAVE